MTEASRTDVHNSQTAAIAPRTGTKRRRLYFPGPLFWIVVATSAIGIMLARSMSDDPTSFHVSLLISAMVCAGGFLAWFRYFSAYALGTRRNLTRAVIGLALVGMIAVAIFATVGQKKLRFSGGLIPHLVTSSALDAKIGQGQADLATTTPIDFPQFLGPNRNSVVRGPKLARQWTSTPPKLLWKHEIGAGWSAFAAVNGYAVTIEQRGDDEDLEVVTCYDVETGQPVWSSGVLARHSSVLGFMGPRSTPTIHQGRVYVMGATGITRCLDGTDGREIWRRDLMDERGIAQADAEQEVRWGRAGSPLVVGDRVIVNVGGAGNNIVTLMALDLETGKTVWEAGTHQIAYASPVLATLRGTPQILSVNQNYVTGHELETGRVIWEHPWEGLSNLNANCSQPVPVGEDRVFLSKGYSGGAELIELVPGESGAGEWSTRSLWSDQVMKTKFSNVALRDGFVYGLDDGILSCIELETGHERWKEGRFGYGQILMVDDLILVMTERKGQLALVEANPKDFVELGRIAAIEGQTWNNLCLYGDRLLLRNSEEAACFVLPTEP
jgi:outer membrane protein assembly factor BamB